ncbi:hypothetical protein [Parasitella parasitica]|uniref:Uncharacterized protein n=1 Tax=Parasitella parasitica TaxID=35722 RepID=A0A0B7NCA6_9FUNG|nr:hypothetical protein [Parasitella parasitica]
MSSENGPDEAHLTEQSENTIVEAVSSSILGAQTTLGAICSHYEQSAQKSVDMASRMALLVQQIYKANMKIESAFAPVGNGNIRMSLTIKNETMLPATSMTGILNLETKDADILYGNDGKPDLFKTPCNLAPQALYTQEIEIRLKKITQCNGTVILNFMNPLSPNDSIELKREFGLYLIDQCKKEILDSKLDLDLVDRLCYPVRFLRDIFEIQPIIGISYGMCIALSSSKYKIVCEVIDMSEDLKSVEVEFTSNDQQVAQRLIEELSILCGV